MGATRYGYTRLQISLHWLVVAMVALQLVIAENITEMVDAIEEGETVSSSVTLLGNVHYWLGLAILAAMVVRLGVRVASGAPTYVGRMPLKEQAAAAMHWALYLVLLAVPVSGLLAYYGLADVGDLHALSRAHTDRAGGAACARRAVQPVCPQGRHPDADAAGPIVATVTTDK